MTVVPGWIWQTMHWLVGMLLVNMCWIGCPGSSLGIVGSMYWTQSSFSEAARPRWPYLANGPEAISERSLA